MDVSVLGNLIRFLLLENGGNGRAALRRRKQKKTTRPNTQRVFGRVGLLANRPPGTAGLPFI
jgi:hypothetical protein